jgi:glycine cleavage system H protein
MAGHDLLTMYTAKAEEYLIAVAFMLLFIPFWRFVNERAVAEPALVLAVRQQLEQMVEWFRVPSHVYFHPGHAWARADGELVTVGMDDFAYKLVGPMSAMRLPPVGARVGQGEKGWALCCDSKWVDMLSPVDGTVVAVNDQVLAAPAVDRDPYGDGWLLKVHSPRREAIEKNLLHGTLARRWMEAVCDQLRGRMEPALGRVYQDGGVPIRGMARSLDPAHWDELVKELFLT